MRTTPCPPPEKLRSLMEEQIEERGLRGMMGLAAHIYGKDDQGRPMQTGPVYGVLAGSIRPSRRLMLRWADALELPADLLMEAAGLNDEGVETPRIGRPPNTPARLALALARDKDKGKDKPVLPSRWGTARPRTLAPPPPPPPAPVEDQPQFSLVIGQDGRAALDLHLTDIPVETAMRAIQTLTSIGILRISPADFTPQRE